MLPPEPSRLESFTQRQDINRAPLLLRAMSGSVVQLQLGSALVSMVHVTLGAHRNHAR